MHEPPVPLEPPTDARDVIRSTVPALDGPPARKWRTEMTEVDHIDVVGAESVLEVAEAVAAVLAAQIEMGGEPGRIVVTGAPDPDLQVVIGLAINDRGMPERWTRRITITHDRSSDERRRWTQHLHRALTERRDWTLTVIPGGASGASA
jgi:hypothetical protein